MSTTASPRSAVDRRPYPAGLEGFVPPATDESPVRPQMHTEVALATLAAEGQGYWGRIRPWGPCGPPGRACKHPKTNTAGDPPFLLTTELT